MMLMAAVYGALAFHYDNEAAINEAIREARELGEQLGAHSNLQGFRQILDYSQGRRFHPALDTLLHHLNLLNRAIYSG